MSASDNRITVIGNIRSAVTNGNYYQKVELNDPVLTFAEQKNITDAFLHKRNTVPFRFKSFCAEIIADVSTAVINRNTEIIGDVDDAVFRKGVIITSNHFAPDENTVIRHFVKKKGLHRLHIVSQVSNFAMKGALGFLMNYADTVPLSDDIRYLAKSLPDVLREVLDAGEAVLIYPEQEMWYRYRKPRPPKPGAYHLAAKLNCPIVSCFVEIVDLPPKDKSDFSPVQYRLHVLGAIYPDANKSIHENSEMMCQTDYTLKKEAYERVYRKPLTYDFEIGDIAGWSPDA